MGKRRLLPQYTSLCVSLVGVPNNYLASAEVDIRLGIRLVLAGPGWAVQLDNYYPSLILFIVINNYDDKQATQMAFGI